MKGFFSPLTGYVTSACSNFYGESPRGRFSTLRPSFNLLRPPVTPPRKPVDIIAAELWDHDDPDEVAEDVVEALEESGWRLVWVPGDGGEGVQPKAWQAPMAIPLRYGSVDEAA